MQLTRQHLVAHGIQYSWTNMRSSEALQLFQTRNYPSFPDILTLIEDDVRGVSTHLWFGRADTRRFVTSLKPKLTAAAQATERLLGDVVALQHAVRAGLDSTHLADLLPTTWSEFIRNADMTDVRPLGIREIEVQRPKFSL